MGKGMLWVMGACAPMKIIKFQILGVQPLNFVRLNGKKSCYAPIVSQVQFPNVFFLINCAPILNSQQHLQIRRELTILKLLDFANKIQIIEQSIS